MTVPRYRADLVRGSWDAIQRLRSRAGRLTRPCGHHPASGALEPSWARSDHSGRRRPLARRGSASVAGGAAA
jgi:hypothetical protein